MEQQEEKTKVYKGTQSKSKSKSSLPLDVSSEILSKLPAKSIVMFRCVSKLWSSITKEQYFINSFQTQSSTQPKLLFCFKKGKYLFVFSIPQPRKSNESYTSQPFNCYHMIFREFGYLSHTESVRGLICFLQSGNLTVLNPSTGKFRTLCKPRKSWTGLTAFLGHDPIDGKHKVVCFPRNTTCNACRVWTLGTTQESWRSIKTNIEHVPYTYLQGRCINGVLYYVAFFNDLDGLGIMIFDVSSEKFKIIQLLSGTDIVKDMLITYEGKLALVVRYPLKNGATLWILEDAEKHEWSNKHFSAHFPRTNRIKLRGITHTFEKPFSIHYFDPKTSIFREIKFKGIREEFGSSYQLHTLPNHVESLMSL